MNTLVAATISSPTTTATVIAAVTAAMQVTSEYLATTQSNFHEKTFTIQGVIFRENWGSFLLSDKGCLHFYIYTDSGKMLISREFLIDGKRHFIDANHYYSISFKGLQYRKYAMR